MTNQMAPITMQTRGLLESACGFSLSGALLGLIVLFLLARPGRPAPCRGGNHEPAP